MKGFVYGLRSLKDSESYIGSTPVVPNRVKDHNNGYVKSTKHRRPLVLEFVLEYDDLKSARRMEHKFKRSYSSLLRELKLRGVVHR